jgi:hypothetical protein
MEHSFQIQVSNASSIRESVELSVSKIIRRPNHDRVQRRYRIATESVAGKDGGEPGHLVIVHTSRGWTFDSFMLSYNVSEARDPSY